MTIKSMGLGIKRSLESLDSLKAVYAPHELPGSISEFPSALIMYDGVRKYHPQYTNRYQTMFRIIILMEPGFKPESFDTLVDYAETSGDDSVPTLIRNNYQLDKSADWAFCESCSGYGTTTWGGLQYTSIEFIIFVQAPY